MSQQGQFPGDLPQHARERLAEMREKKLFTSDLSVNEFLLVKQAGFDPLGLVMGSSIYQIAPNFPQVPYGQPGCEVWDMTRALYHARELAMNRMEEEAEALGADGIVGVRLTVNLDATQQQQWSQSQMLAWWQQQSAWWTQRGMAAPPPPFMQNKTPQKAAFALGQNVAEFLAVGTAVKHRDGKSFKNARGKPFQSDLTGQEFWTLLRAGYRPVGFVMGNCVYYVPPNMLQVPDQQSCELPAYTHALYDARELAIERLQAEAEALQATGIVGVTVTEKSHAWRRQKVQTWWQQQSPQQVGNAALQSGELIELFVIGTAVVPMEQSEEVPKPHLVMAANDLPVVENDQGGEE